MMQNIQKSYHSVLKTFDVNALWQAWPQQLKLTTKASSKCTQCKSEHTSWKCQNVENAVDDIWLWNTRLPNDKCFFTMHINESRKTQLTRQKCDCHDQSLSICKTPLLTTTTTTTNTTILLPFVQDYLGEFGLDWAGFNVPLNTL